MEKNESLIEEKQVLMVSPTGSVQTFRKAHFIKPTLSSSNDLPQQSLKLSCFSPKQELLQVTYSGWPNVPSIKWKAWVKTMHSKYSLLWEKAGIFDAIMLSTLKIKRNEGFLLSLVENWCPETNTFMFHWGEATVTLEDVMILGGFSVLGDPVLSELEKDDKLVEIREFFQDCRKNLGSLEKDVFNVDWLYHFMDCGSVYEHEAFLALWLLTYVIPGWDDKVFGVVFDLAVWLGRGRRFALGPCVLASLYRDLGILRGAMVGSQDDDCSAVTMWSPLYIVQAWAWERLPLLQPKPNRIGSGEARMKRWHGEKKGRVSVSESGVNSAGLSFIWRPYVIAVDDWSLPKFYVEKELFLRREELSLELESFFRCLRPCVLVGVDSHEQYNPHRVSMQFGFDQDIPGMILKEHVSSEIGWYDYNKPLSDDVIFYVPPRLFEADVSVTYMEWWRSVLCPVNPFKDIPKGRRSCRKQREFTLSYRKQGHYAEVFQDFVRNKTKININRCENGKPNPNKDLDVPPGFEHVHAARIASLNGPVAEEKANEVTNRFVETAKEGFTSTENADDPPPGFGHVRPGRFRSLNDLVAEAKSNEVANNSVMTAKQGSIDDAPPGFGSSTKSTVGKQTEKSLSEFPPKRNKLVRKNENLSKKEVPANDSQYSGYRRTAPPAVTNQIVDSITGKDYMNAMLNKAWSVLNESEQLTYGSSSNCDVEEVSDIEADVSRIEEEVAVLKRSKRRKISDVSDIKAQVALIKARVSKIEAELAARGNDEDI